jgi:hypothetical protein
MSTVGRFGDERRGPLFWVAVLVAVLLPLRMVVRALEAPLPVRLLLGMTLLAALGWLAGLLFVGRLRGHVTAVRAMTGVWGVAVFLVAFMLFEGGSPLANVLTGLAGLVAVGAALAASLSD